MELRLKESEEKVSDLDARASIAKQRIAILERELETSRDMQKDLQSELAAARAQAAADRQHLQVRLESIGILKEISDACLARCMAISALLRYLIVGPPCLLLLTVVCRISNTAIHPHDCKAMSGNFMQSLSMSWAAVLLQSKVDKLSDALRASQKQAKQADAEAQEMEKAFRVLQTEASAGHVCSHRSHATTSHGCKTLSHACSSCIHLCATARW